VVYRFEGLIEQAVSNTEFNYGFSTSSDKTRLIYGSLDPPPPTTLKYLELVGRWCWSSDRGHSVDIDVSAGGVCAAGPGELCYVYANGTSGCAIAPTVGTNITVSADGYIQWGTAGVSKVAGFYCMSSATDNFCISTPTNGIAGQSLQVPRNVLNSSHYSMGPTTLPALTVVKAPPTAWAPTIAACGCDTIDYHDASAANYPSDVYRSNVVGGCYVSNVALAVGDFNCGTYFGWFPNNPIPSPFNYSTVCSSCESTQPAGIPTVGQCKNDTGHCAGFDHVLDECPVGFTRCTDVNPPGTTIGITFPDNTVITNLITKSTGFPYVFSTDGVTYDLYGVMYNNRRWVPDVVGVTSTTILDLGVPSATVADWDKVNCLPVYGYPAGAAYTLNMVEIPSYLSVETVPISPDKPAGITEAAIRAWCSSDAGAPCDLARKWWCIDLGQDTDHSLSSAICVLRTARYSVYSEIDAGGGKKSGTFTRGPSVIHPRCSAWVSGIDLDSECQDPSRFTGCVITETNRHWSSVTDSEVGEMWPGVYYTRTENLIVSGLAATDRVACSKLCATSSQCGIWVYDTTCALYMVGPLEFEPRIGSTTGTRGGASFGVPIPRTHTGPVLPSISTYEIQNTYSVTGATFFVMNQNGSTAPWQAGVPNTTLSAGNKLVYFNGTGLQILSLDGANVTISPPMDGIRVTPLMVTVSFTPVNILGLLQTEFATGFQSVLFSDDNTTSGANLGRGTGIRGVFFGPNRGPVSLVSNGTTLDLYEWHYDTVATVSLITPAVAKQMRRTCVPLTIRIEASESSLDDLTTNLEIRRLDPVDCQIAGTIVGDLDVVALFTDGGMCSGAQSFSWTDSSVGVESNLRHYTQWSRIMSMPMGIMTDHSTPTLPTTIHGISVPGPLPNCDSSSPIQCVVAFDKTGFIPCAGVFRNTIPTCANPVTAGAMFPLHDPENPAIPGTPVNVPVGLYSTDTTPSRLTDTSTYIPYDSTGYLLQINYCNFFGVGVVPQGTTGWKPQGKPIYCDGDDLTSDERIVFCSTYQPWWVLSGRVVRDLTFDDICSFTGGVQQCFVFSDGHFPTIGSLLASRIPDDLDWSDTTFYYVPFTYKVLTHLLLDQTVSNTLWSNDIFSSVATPVTKDNYDKYGPSVKIAAAHLNHLSDDDRTILDGFCGGSTSDSRTTAITVRMLEILYKIVKSFYDPATDTYILPSMEDGSAASTVSLGVGDVQPIFKEVNTPLDYNGITVTTIGNTQLTLGQNPNVIVNQVDICTRFQVSGSNIVIENLVMDQSLCTYTGVFARTPIVISGNSGDDCVIQNLDIVDSGAAVAVIGGDNLVYRRRDSVDIDGLYINNIRFSYTNVDTDPFNQNIISVMAEATGIPTVVDCNPFQAVVSPSGATSQLSNCLVQYTPIPDKTDCTLPGECATSDCCWPHTIQENTCEYGILCAGTLEDLTFDIYQRPNQKIFCNLDWCVEPMVVTNDATCFYNASNCTVSCDDYYDGNFSTVTQDWQYNPGTNGTGWYSVPTYTTLGTETTYVKGVGSRDLVWMLSPPTNTTLYPSELVVIQGRLIPGAITVIPDFDSGDGTVVYGPSTQLYLNVDWFVGYNGVDDYTASFIAEIENAGEWCVRKQATGRVGVVRCSDAGTDWYIDKITGLIHTSGDPMLCVSSFPGTSSLHLLPCLPCFIGIEKLKLSDSQASETQLFTKNDSGVVYDALYGTLLTTGALKVLGSFEFVDWYGYIIDSSAQCATAYKNGSIGWTGCNADLMFPDLGIRCGPTTAGLFRRLCGQGYGGPLRRVEFSGCVASGPVVSQYGTAGVVSTSDNGTVTITASGHGYLDGSDVSVGACNATAFTSKVILQFNRPGFDVTGSGWQLINMTAISGYIPSDTTVHTSIESLDLGGLGTLFDYVVWIVVVILVVFIFAANKYKADVIEHLAKKTQ
jgi:hypothetical protein